MPGEYYTPRRYARDFSHLYLLTVTINTHQPSRGKVGRRLGDSFLTAFEVLGSGSGGETVVYRACRGVRVGERALPGVGLFPPRSPLRLRRYTGQTHGHYTRAQWYATVRVFIPLYVATGAERSLVSTVCREITFARARMLMYHLYHAGGRRRYLLGELRVIMLSSQWQIHEWNGDGYLTRL